MSLFCIMRINNAAYFMGKHAWIWIKRLVQLIEDYWVSMCYRYGRREDLQIIRLRILMRFQLVLTVFHRFLLNTSFTNTRKDWFFHTKEPAPIHWSPFLLVHSGSISSPNSHLIIPVQILRVHNWEKQRFNILRLTVVSETNYISLESWLVKHQPT